MTFCERTGCLVVQKIKKIEKYIKVGKINDKDEILTNEKNEYPLLEIRQKEALKQIHRKER